MTIESLIEVIALLIAAYQIMPRHRQLQFKLRFRLLDWIVVGFALIIILYLQLFAVFSSLGWTLSLGLHRWELTPQLASFIVVILLTVFLMMRFRFTQISPRQVGRLSQLFDELLWSGRDQELVLLLIGNAERLMTIAADKTAISSLRSALNDEPSRGFPFQFDQMDRIDRFLSLPGDLLYRGLPNYSNESDAAKSLLLKLTKAPSIADAIVKTDPYFGLRLLESDAIDKDTFLTNYFSAQLRYPLSALHYEIRHCQRFAWDRPYDISDAHKLLGWLFADASLSARR